MPLCKLVICQCSAACTRGNVVVTPSQRLHSAYGFDVHASGVHPAEGMHNSYMRAIEAASMTSFYMSDTQISANTHAQFDAVDHKQ